MRLPNKIGIATAAGSGMGRAGALRFAAEGASVAVVDLNADAANDVVKDIQKAGGKAIALSGDLTDDAFARGIVRETTRAFGALDFVWNHVGHPGPAAIEGLEWKDYDLALNLNVRTVLVTTEAALPELRARGGGGGASGVPAGALLRACAAPGLARHGARVVLLDEKPVEAWSVRPTSSGATAASPAPRASTP